jgi:DNA invertase Pin-like site-specific DNA recombinase
MLFGYARVSTLEQDTSLQISALRAARCDRIVQEKRSAVKHRPELVKLLGQLQAGDVLVVYKLDRLARSLQHLLSILEQLQAVGASIKSLTEPIATDTPAGRMMIQVLGAVAEFERAIIRERSIAGRVEAVKAGRSIGGRPPRLMYEELREILALRDAGFTYSVLADAYGVSESYLCRIVLEASGKRQRPWGVVRRLVWGL